MSKTAWVFPGQGSQAVGMGQDLADLPQGAARFQEAAAILGWSVLDRCNGDEETLSRTLYTQPCLYVIEAILVDLLKAAGHQPDLVAGHSLGEYAALYAAGVLDFATGLKLVQQRAQLMDQAAGGKMAALMKFDRPQLEAAIATTAGVVLANDNSDQQVVISGSPEAVDQILGQVKAKRAVELKVSGAFHSPFMDGAAQTFNQTLEGMAFATTAIPVLSNVDPTPETEGDRLKARLMAQMTGSVRWREIMDSLPGLGVTQAVEVGPGKVLAGLIKRACGDLAVANVGTGAEVTTFGQA